MEQHQFGYQEKLIVSKLWREMERGRERERVQGRERLRKSGWGMNKRY